MCIFTNSLMFLNIMQNQGVILYIFPHIYPFAQPTEKRGFERNLKAFFVCLIIMEKRLGCEIVELFLTCTISHLCLSCFSRE